MRIEEIGDGLDVSAVIAAAGALHDVLDERQVDIALIEGGAYIVARASAETGPPFLAASVERKPKVVRVAYEDSDGPTSSDSDG